MTEQFVPITNLDNLNEDQKKQYMIQVCAYFDLPAQLGLLEYMRLEGGDGSLHTVLYAKKGATDMLRDKRGIAVDETKETISDKIAMFVVKGHDKSGRTEMAVGVSSIENLMGKELANQIMAAHTKATRRLTLEFVGGGFLDESEVAPTEVTKNLRGVEHLPASVPASNATAPKLQEPTAEQLEAQRILANIDPEKLAKAVGEEPKRRRRSNAVDFSVPEPKTTPSFDLGGPPNVTSTQVPIPAAAYEPANTPVPKDVPVTPSTTVESQASPLSAPVTENLPSPEQTKEFRVRLTKYTETILPQAGMVPSEKIGGISSKVRLYVMKRYNLLDLKKMTVTQWTELLSFFDSTEPASLVHAIEEAIK